MPFYANGSWYPYLEFANGTLADMGAYNSQVTGYAFGVGALILIYIVFLVAGTRASNGDMATANASASFVAWICSILMVAMTSTEYGGAWLPAEAAYATTFLLVISGAALFLKGRG